MCVLTHLVTKVLLSVKMAEKAALRELFQDPEFIEQYQKTVLIPAVEAAVAAANSQRDEKITELEEELTKTQEELNNTNQELAAARRRLDAMETYSRRNCLSISGVPERDGESTDQLVADISKAAGVTIAPTDLDRSHRIGQRKGGRHRNIVVKLLSYNVRQRLYEARRDLSAHRVPGHSVLTREVLEGVYITDLLTPKAQHLLYIGRQLKKKGKLSAAYSTNGAVKVRTSETQPAKTISEVTDFAGLLGASERALNEVLEACGHPSPHVAAAAGAAGGSNDTAWRRVPSRGSGKTAEKGDRPQTRSSKVNGTGSG